MPFYSQVGRIYAGLHLFTDTAVHQLGLSLVLGHGGVYRITIGLGLLTATVGYLADQPLLTESQPEE